MKKTALYIFAASLLLAACTKSSYTPITFEVDNTMDVYVPDSGSVYYPVQVKFLSGDAHDSVHTVLTGLPAAITVAQDTFAAIPTYTAGFVLTGHHAAFGTYPATVVVYAGHGGYKKYGINVHVVSESCASAYAGGYSGSNVCSATSPAYTASATLVAGNQIAVNNLGGYGTNTTAYVILDCNSDSLHIASQNIGNGVTLQGSGTYTAGRLSISYTAVNVPAGGNDNCTAVLTRQ